MSGKTRQGNRLLTLLVTACTYHIRVKELKIYQGYGGPTLQKHQISMVHLAPYQRILVREVGNKIIDRIEPPPAELGCLFDAMDKRLDKKTSDIYQRPENAEF